MTHTRCGTSYGKEIYYILCILLAVGFALFSIVAQDGYLGLRRARLELEAHRSRVNAIRRDDKRHVENIRKLKFDYFALEEYARQNGYAREIDVVQRAPDKASPPPR